MSSVEFSVRVANRRIEELRQEWDVIAQSKAADECRDCDDFVSLLVEAVEYLKRANASNARAMFIHGYDKERADLLLSLAHAWMGLCEAAEEQAAIHHQRGFQVEKFSDLKCVKRDVQAAIAAVELQHSCNTGFYVPDNAMAQILAMPPLNAPDRK